MSIDFHFSPNVAVQVRDRVRAVDFYRDVLGFEVIKHGANESKLRKGPMTFFVEGLDGSTASAPSVTGASGSTGVPGTTFWEFEVSDFAAAQHALIAAGCCETQRNAPTSAMFADPYGLRFHVFQTGTELPDCQ